MPHNLLTNRQVFLELLHFPGLSASKLRIAIRYRFFTADSGIAGIHAVGISVARLEISENRRSLAILHLKQITHLGP